jgi:hypothetical protein
VPLICSVIEELSQSGGRDKAHLQKVAGDIMAIDKLGNILMSMRTSEVFDSEMEDGESANDSTTTNLRDLIKINVQRTLASLSSEEDSCRKKIVDNKKLLEELFAGLKNLNKEVKLTALQCFVSLSRSDKMTKSIIVDHGDIHKEIL